MKRKLFQSSKAVALILTLALLLATMSGILCPQAFAGVYEPPLSNAIETYYGGSQEGVLDDWEEFAAVYAYLEGREGNSYAAGVDLSGYVLPSDGTGAGGLFTALMKGDASRAALLADSLVLDGALIDPGNIYTYAVQVLALEAYNRSTGIIPVSYSTHGAVEHLLNAQDETGGYMDWGYPSYDNAGLVLTVLSLPVFKDDPSISSEKAALIDWIKSGQSSTGAFSSFGSDSANTTACVLFGLSAGNEDLSAWTTSPALGLISQNLYSDTDGWLSWSGAPWDAYATKQATLALAEIESGTSFYASLELNPTPYMSAAMQLVKPDGTFIEKDVTFAGGASLDDVASAVSGSAVTGGLAYYENGTTATSIGEGSSILAVALNFNSIVYFSLDDSGIGIPTANIDFGSTAVFSLKELVLSTANTSTMANIPIDANADSYGDLYSSVTGEIQFSPINPYTALMPISSDYFGNYIAEDAAVLPAYVNMASGGAQVKTVSVRVEGPSSNILYYSAYDVTGSGSTRLTVGDAVEQTLIAAGKSYTYSGGYLSMVDGIYAGSYDPDFYDGWVYYINGIAGGTMGGQTIAEGDEIILYYGYYPGYGTDLVSINAAASGDNVTLTVLNGDLPVPEVQIFWNGSVLPSTTDVLGQVVIQEVAAGTYPVQISKTDAYGVPLIVRLAGGTAVTVTEEGGSAGGGSGDTQTAAKIYITVKGLDGEILYSKTGQTYYVGITARDALDASGLTVLGNNSYVSSIDGLAEFDYGSGSGWLYMVNSTLPGATAADDYELSVEDHVVWYYTRNYTSDGNVKDSMEGLTEEEVLAALKTFEDVQKGAWYEDAVTSVSGLGLFNGISEQHFGPELTMTREMFVTILGRLFERGHVMGSLSVVPFEDVAEGGYYAAYVNWASQNGIVEGIEKNRFGVALPVSREQMVVMMYRYMRLLGLAQKEEAMDLSGYTDRDSISDWAKAAVAWAVKNGLLTGKADDLLDPLSSSSRAEVAMFVLRCFNYMDENTI
jgi:hypothetical protein